MAAISEDILEKACNTDCMAYRQGVCQYRYNEKEKCLRVRAFMADTEAAK